MSHGLDSHLQTSKEAINITHISQEDPHVKLLDSVEERDEKQDFISTFSAGSTVINILLATGPFTLPYAFFKGGLSH